MRTICVTALVLALAGCGSPAEDSSEGSHVMLSEPARAPAPAPNGYAGRSDAAGSASEAQAPFVPTNGRPATPAMIIRTGHASVEVDALDPAVAQVRSVVARLGGYVANVSIQGGEQQARSATLELKIPAPRFEEATSALAPLGEVEFVNVTAQDVGEEFVDISARAANARRLETRLVELLGTRTGKLADVLAVERELARVREEIERHEGRLRFLESRTAVSTLNLTLHEPLPLVGLPGSSPIGDAFRQAWRNFVALTAAAIASLGVLLPLAVLVGAVVYLLRRMRRRTAPAEA